MLLLAALPALATLTEIRPRPTRDYNERSDKGWCSIRVWVDDEVNIFVAGDRVVFETVSGRRAHDAGSECSQPMPRGGLYDFRFRGVDGRGHVDLVEEPSPRNRYRAWVRIIDRRGGGEEHHFRLWWRSGGGWSSSGRYGGGYGHDRYRDDFADGVCFYTGRDYGGERVCGPVGQMTRSIRGGGYRSVRFFGRARELEVFDQEDCRGGSRRYSRDVPDLYRDHHWTSVRSFRVH
jgi:hypothetical protein